MVSTKSAVVRRLVAPHPGRRDAETILYGVHDVSAVREAPNLKVVPVNDRASIVEAWGCVVDDNKTRLTDPNAGDGRKGAHPKQETNHIGDTSIGISMTAALEFKYRKLH